MDEFGYCLIEAALSDEQVAAIRTRLHEQKAAEEALDVSYQGADGKQLVKFLVNKGRMFRDLLFTPSVRSIVDHVLGPAYLLSSFHAHFAPPGRILGCGAVRG